MKEYLIIDGYNVINAWPEFNELKEDSLEHARERLVDIVASYSAYKGVQAIVVFDAHAVIGPVAVCKVVNNVEVVFTNEGETADSYIEKMVYCLVRQGERVDVVTSDWAEQIVVLGAGACRISAREFRKDVQAVNKVLSQRFTNNVVTSKRHELENRLSSDVLKRLNEIRHGRE